MKIGVFISTQIRHDQETLNLNIDLLREAFGTNDFVFGVWDYQVDEYKEFLNTLTNVEVFEHFDIEYQPYIDNPNAIMDYQYQKKLKSPNPRHKHQTKQILLHNELMKKYGSMFDVVVRSRWDGTVSPLIDFVPYAREVYETPCTMNICTRDDYQRSILHIGERSDWKYPFLNHRSSKEGEVVRGPVSDMFLDSGIIIHRTVDWDCEAVDKLHNEKKLLAAEFGWWQVLVEATKHQQWVHYDGGASITRTVIKDEMIKIKKVMI